MSPPTIRPSRSSSAVTSSAPTTRTSCSPKTRSSWWTTRGIRYLSLWSGQRMMQCSDLLAPRPARRALDERRRHSRLRITLLLTVIQPPVSLDSPLVDSRGLPPPQVASLSRSAKTVSRRIRWKRHTRQGVSLLKSSSSSRHSNNSNNLKQPSRPRCRSAVQPRRSQQESGARGNVILERIPRPPLPVAPRGAAP